MPCMSTRPTPACVCAAVHARLYVVARGAVPGLGFQAELVACISGVAIWYELPACAGTPDPTHIMTSWLWLWRGGVGAAHREWRGECKQLMCKPVGPATRTPAFPKIRLFQRDPGRVVQAWWVTLCLRCSLFSRRCPPCRLLPRNTSRQAV